MPLPSDNILDLGSPGPASIVEFGGTIPAVPAGSQIQRDPWYWPLWEADKWSPNDVCVLIPRI